MKLIERKKCIISDEKDLEELYTFKNFPIFMGTTSKKREQDICVDMTFEIAPQTGMIQLKTLIPLESLYEESHNSSIGKVWKQHHMCLAEFLKKCSPKSVFEIGGGNGRLELYYNKNQEKKIPWTILEPTEVDVLEGCNANYIHDFWSEEYELPQSYQMDTLVHSHVLEHIYNPLSFMKKCSSILAEGQNMVFSLPNLEETLKRKYTNALNFEHTYFISDQYVEWLLSKNHFEVIEKQFFCEDHSIFYAVKKNSNIVEKPLSTNLYEKNKKIFMDYIEYYNSLVNNLNKKMKKENSKIYLFGAHIFSQYLIEFGLDEAKICGVLDNDAMKQGKRLYGTSLKVSSPKILREENEPIVILKVGNYAEEIKKDIIENINCNAIFWE